MNCGFSTSGRCSCWGSKGETKWDEVVGFLLKSISDDSLMLGFSWLFFQGCLLCNLVGVIVLHRTCSDCFVSTELFGWDLDSLTRCEI